MTLKNILLALLLVGTQAQAETRYTYYHNDLFGSPVVMTDQAGAVIARKDYTPYGETSGNDGSNHIGFTGHVEDSLTHLTYMQQRMQDPKTGRFLSIDPAGVNINDPMSFNRYAYGNNNPYKFVDPDGGKVEFAPGTSSGFKADYSAARSYLSGTAAGNILNKLDAHSGTVVLIESSGATETTPAGDYGNGWQNTIVDWNPKDGNLIESTGEVQSSALGLGHEADHALRDLSDWQGLENDASTPDAQYDWKEERRVITGSEKSTAKSLGEPTRNTHSQGSSSRTVSNPTEHKKK